MVSFKLLPGQTYTFAACLTQRDDPTGADVPALSLPPTLVFADAAFTAGQDLTTFGFLRVGGDNVGVDYTLPDGTPSRKYIRQLLGAQSLTPFLARMDQIIFIYILSGTDLLEPWTAQIVRVPGVRRFSSVDG